MEKQINTRVLSKIDTQSNWDMATSSSQAVGVYSPHNPQIIDDGELA